MVLYHYSCPKTSGKIKHYERKHVINQDVERINTADVSIISLLGTGSFSSVHGVFVATESSPLRQDMADQLPEYALKCLQVNKLKGKKDLFVAGVKDLVCEAELLSHLNHKNIIKLQGICSQSVSESYKTKDDIGYFLLLDVLPETLVDRLDSWRVAKDGKNNKHINYFNNPLRSHQHRESTIDMWDRIEDVVMGVCDAMEYLHHSKKVIFHDLKPDNIGFDIKGTVKLFDFGFARYFADDVDDGEIAGTFRYMAPESMMGECSGFPSDVYSFSILLWEMCTLRKPFDSKHSTNMEEFVASVTFRDLRPPLCSVPNKAVRKLCQHCWDPNPLDRPTFTDISNSLSDISTEIKQTFSSSSSHCHQNSPSTSPKPLQKMSLRSLPRFQKLHPSTAHDSVRKLCSRFLRAERLLPSGVVSPSEGNESYVDISNSITAIENESNNSSDGFATTKTTTPC